MRGRLALAALLLSGCIAPAAAIASMRAEQITAETAPELFIGGPDAIGGVGDWYLANDVVEVIVDDPGRRFAKLNHGGTIVDAGLRDRDGEDQFARIFPIVNMDQSVFIDFDSIRAEMNEEEGWARLVVSNAGRMNSVRRKKGWKRWLDPLVPEADELRDVAVETEYAVFRGEPFVHITTTFRNAGPHPAPIISYGDVWMRGGRSGRSWVGNTLDPVRSRGFHHLSFDRRNILAAGDAMAAFTHVSVPGMPQYPPIAYAIFAPERAARQLRQFGVTGKHVTLINAFANDPDWDEMSLMRLAVATRNELPPGESWTFRRRLLITGRADAASTTDVIFPLLGLRGRVERHRGPGRARERPYRDPRLRRRDRSPDHADRDDDGGRGGGGVPRDPSAGRVRPRVSRGPAPDAERRGCGVARALRRGPDGRVRAARLAALRPRFRGRRSGPRHRPGHRGHRGSDLRARSCSTSGSTGVPARAAPRRTRSISSATIAIRRAWRFRPGATA